MNRRLTIAGITTTRADYGHLYWPFKSLIENQYDLKIVVSGSHLSPQHGLSYKEIEKDGFPIAEKLDILSQEDSILETTTALSRATSEFAHCFQRLQPDLILLLGDRYEVLGAAQAALIMGIPVAHLAGGDSTEGAFDESIRHAITKMSHLHFVTNDVAAQRVRQLGENPKHVYNIGSPGLDFILNSNLLTKKQLENELSIRFLENNLLVTFHSETLEEKTIAHFEQLLTALDQMDNTGIIFTRPNADPGGVEINRLIDAFVDSRTNVNVFTNLGSHKYLSVMAAVDAIVGNSSSGIYEAPTLKTATVNIGDRQKGRLAASSVINCPPQTRAIKSAIEEAMSLDCTSVTNPYGDGMSSKRLVEILNGLPNPKSLLRKRFFFINEQLPSQILQDAW